MAKKKRILYPVLFMIVITAFFTFILSFVNEFTKEIIESQNELLIQRSIFYVFGVDTETLTDEDIQKEFKDKIVKNNIDNKIIYTYKKDNIIKGYAVEVSGSGLWGIITSHIAFDPNHENIIGVNFISHAETPGLGGRIDELIFKEQFRNISLSDLDNIFSFNKSTGGNLDAISGATITSMAVRDIFNLEIPKILEFAKKEGFYEGN